MKHILVKSQVIKRKGAIGGVQVTEEGDTILLKELTVKPLKRLKDFITNSAKVLLFIFLRL